MPNWDYLRQRMLARCRCELRPSIRPLIDGWTDCPACSGSGVVPVPADRSFAGMFTQDECSLCSGSGSVLQSVNYNWMRDAVRDAVIDSLRVPAELFSRGAGDAARAVMLARIEADFAARFSGRIPFSGSAP